MDKAKSAITDFMGRSGHHDTTVHETVAPAVQNEVVKPHTHEEVNTAIDKEVHQDHYHRTVQPVQHREVLPEEHTAKLGGVQHRQFDHREHDTTKRHLAEEQARFTDERRIDDHTHSQSVAPTVGGEHVHHHIHETIQPVVQKETIQPNVVHTTVPIHEVHHNKATHHDTTALPAMTMDQFTSKGGSLAGREERYDAFEGVPKNIGGAGGMSGAEGLERKAMGHEHARHGDYDGVAEHGREGARHEGGLREGGLREGGMGHNSTGTHNPLDRNNDGRVNARDVAGSRSHGERGLDHTDRGEFGQGNMAGSSDQGGLVGSNERSAHRSNAGMDASEDLRDPARSQNVGATGTKDSKGNVMGSSDKGDMEHRPNEDGSLPRALTEEKSKAVPHSKAQENAVSHDKPNEQEDQQ